jgi:ankyrin repeat protein
MQENLRGEMTPPKKEELIIDIKNQNLKNLNSNKNSNKNIKFNYNKNEQIKKDEQIFALNLIPSIINELVEKNNYKMLKKLKNYIKNINFSDFCTKNPLHISSREGNLNLVKFFVKLRIGINDMDEYKLTPLNYACKYGKKEVAFFLKKKGGILNYTNELSYEFCNYGKIGDLDKLRIYYECGANLNIEDHNKRTISHIAAAEGHIDIIKFLVEETNVNILSNDKWGNTPYSEAKNKEIRDIIKNKYKSCNFFFFFFSFFYFIFIFFFFLYPYYYFLFISYFFFFYFYLFF